MWRNICSIAYAGSLGLIFAIGGWQLYGGTVPALAAIGLMLTAVAPIIFIVWSSQARSGQRQHPVLVSAAMGLGCVCIMVSIQRFGDQHRWLLVLALLALAGWMAYQRWIWRAKSSQESA